MNVKTDAVSRRSFVALAAAAVAFLVARIPWLPPARRARLREALFWRTLPRR